MQAANGNRLSRKRTRSSVKIEKGRKAKEEGRVWRPRSQRIRTVPSEPTPPKQPTSFAEATEVDHSLREGRPLRLRRPEASAKDGSLVPGADAGEHRDGAKALRRSSTGLQSGKGKAVRKRPHKAPPPASTGRSPAGTSKPRQAGPKPPTGSRRKPASSEPSPQEEHVIEIRLSNRYGLHMRPAKQTVELANSFPCELSLVAKGQDVDAKSILGIIGLGAECGDEVVVRARGPGAEVAAKSLARLLGSLAEIGGEPEDLASEAAPPPARSKKPAREGRGSKPKGDASPPGRRSGRPSAGV